MRSTCPAVLLLAALACTPSSNDTASPAGDSMVTAASDSTARLAHDAYTTAINSNDLDQLSAMFTDDVVFLVPNAPPMIGRAAVMDWGKGYLEAFTTHWDKTTEEFEVAGEWAFERYSYHSVDTPRDGTAPIEDTGWGLVIYHRDADGTWRVARDAFASDHPAATP